MFLVLTLNNGLPDEMLHIGDDREKANTEFISAAKTRVPRWDSFTDEDVSNILDDGHVECDGDYLPVGLDQYAGLRNLCLQGHSVGDL